MQDYTVMNFISGGLHACSTLKNELLKRDHDLNQLLYSVLLTIEKKIPYYINLNKKIPEGTWNGNQLYDHAGTPGLD